MNAQYQLELPLIDRETTESETRTVLDKASAR